MSSFSIQTPSEQVATHLRELILAGNYRKVMPGKVALARELGVDPKTAGLAMELLERQKLLISQGAGKPRRIALPEDHAVRGLRIHLLPHDRDDAILPYILDFVRLAEEAGHRVEIQSKTLQDLKMDPDLVSRHVEENPADAWVVVAAFGRVLKWFAGQPTPAFALFGRIAETDIASVNVRPFKVIGQFLDRLISHGHRRIVWIVRANRRYPVPGVLEQFFLDHLSGCGIPANRFYNLPEWEETPEGLEQRLESLFRTTPPTALIATEPELFLAVQNLVVKRGLQVPRDVSLVCMDVFEGDPSFKWMIPEVSHYRWKWQPVSGRLIRWLNNIARGKADLRQVQLEAKYIAGSTIGPARNE